MKNKIYYLIRDSENIGEIEILSRLGTIKQIKEVKSTYEKNEPFYNYKILTEYEKLKKT